MSIENPKKNEKKREQVKLFKSGATDRMILIHDSKAIDTVLVVESDRNLQIGHFT